jgi:polyisoprenoid-binding protein YceI
MADTTFHDLKGEWVIDPAHTRLGFRTKHMMFTTVRGSFEEIEGAFSVPDDPANTTGRVVMKTKSINTGNQDRDNHLRTNDFFEADKYPEIVFESTGIEIVSGQKAKLTGDLTVRDVTKPVSLDLVLEGYVDSDAFGSERVGMNATTSINREDWGLTWNKSLETGGVLVAKEATLELDIAAVKQG